MRKIVHGKVTVWRMTEKERLAYIAKHPIQSTEKPKGSTFAEINDAQYQKAKKNRLKQESKPRERIIDRVDKDKLHRLYIDGEPLKDIAGKLGVSESTLNYFLREQRKLNPEKWPHRQPR